MRLTTLGTWSAAVPAPGGRGSGHLVASGDTRVLLDCGNGVLGELARHARLEDLSAVVLSHLHNDHVADLYPLALFHKYTKRRVRVLAPAGTRTLIYRWFSLFTSDPESYVGALDLVEYAAWNEYRIGDVTIVPAPVEHNIPSHAIRVEGSGRTLVYSGDTKESALLEEAAKGCDLLLCEATYGDPAPPGALDHHMSAAQAGALARRAAARRLVLTHFLVTQDPAALRAQAEATFGAPVELAAEGAVFDVTAGRTS